MKGIPVRVLAMLHLYTPVHNAGAELMAHAMLRSLAAAGHQVDVILSRDHYEIREPYTHDGVTVHPRRHKGDPLQWIADPRRRPDVIVTHLENTERASVLGQQHNIPVIHLLHNTFEQTKRDLRRGPALAVANTDWMAEDVTAWWLWRHGAARPMPPLTVVRPPVVIDDYATTPGNRVTLINLCADKGVDVFYSLAKRFPRRKFLGVAGAYGTQVRLDLPNVEIVDHVRGDRIRDEVYARTRVLLMPSVYESFGRCAVEAACSGIPTIAHPTAGLLESLGTAGTFVDREDIDGWEDALGRLLSPSEWPAASRRARERATELDPTEDLQRWASTVEVIGATARHVG
jgi:glycosyltransferase involved in cell wall biosynthesis